MEYAYEITARILEDIRKGQEMNNLVSTTPNGITPRRVITADMLDRFIRYLDVTPKSVATYSRSLRQFMGYLAENGITEPTREDVITWRETLKETHKPTTVQTYIVSVRLFFKWTEQEGLYPDITSHLKGAKISRNHKRDYLTSSQLKRVLAGIDRSTEEGRRNYAICLLMIVGGLRTIEVTRARVEDLRPLGNGTILNVQGKGREERSDYTNIPNEVETAIRISLADRKDATGDKPLFISLSNNSKGKPLTTRSVSAIIKTALVNAGFNSDKWTGHSLRHSAITLAINEGNSLQDVRQFARHTDVSTTMIYFHEQERINNKCESTIVSALF